MTGIMKASQPVTNPNYWDCGGRCLGISTYAEPPSGGFFVSAVFCVKLFFHRPQTRTVADSTFSKPPISAAF